MLLFVQMNTHLDLPLSVVVIGTSTKYFLMIHNRTVSSAILLRELNRRTRSKKSSSRFALQHNWFAAFPVFGRGAKVTSCIADYLPVISSIPITFTVTKSSHLVLTTQWTLYPMSVQIVVCGNMCQSYHLSTFNRSSSLANFLSVSFPHLP